MSGDKVVAAKLVFNTTQYCLWVGTVVNKKGQGKHFIKRMPALVHIISSTSDEALCGRVKLVHTTDTYRNSGTPWGTQRLAKSMVTSVERHGTLSCCAATNVTFLKLCKECMALSYGVHVGLDIGKDINNQWYLDGPSVVELADKMDFDEWKEKGLNV